MAGRTPRNINSVKEMLKNEGMYLINTEEDMEKMLDVMVSFYSKDALFNWMCDGEYDETIARNILRAGLFSMPNAISYADSPEFNAVAAWIPPGNKVLSIIPYLKNGGYDLYKQRGIRIAYKLLSYQGYAGKMHKNVTGKGDWYLFSYAVNPDVDSSEFSEKILRPITGYAWDTGEACYCEVTSEAGINFMKAAGFQVRHQGKVPGSNVDYYGVMV